MSNKSLWVFGYGSLLWAPGFAFTGIQHGTVKGYTRKFWQGNTTHRGTPSQPGRVATLIEDKEGEVWGVAYEVADAQALPYLDDREVKLGGYKTAFTTFHPENGEEPFLALLYMATPDSSYWLGNASESDIAENILSSSGSSGHNVEYLLRLAEFVRNSAPEIDDPHLFNLESIVRRRIEERQLPLDKLMGPPKPLPRPISKEESEEADTLAPLNFVSTIQPKKLRCLTI